MQTIDVPFYGGLFVPNALTPSTGPDGVREFLPKGKNLKSYYVQIYNRWGTKVFESSTLDENGSPAEGWDGNYNGSPCPQGNYVWKIYAEFKDGNVWRGVGTKNPSN